MYTNGGQFVTESMIYSCGRVGLQILIQVECQIKHLKEM